MTVWLLVFINCIQFEGKAGNYPVKCQVLNHKEPFKTRKECSVEKKKFPGVDASCVKVTVWKV